MSDEESENEAAENGDSSEEPTPSIFDLFDPPPDAQSEGFGPIPVVEGAHSSEGSEPEVELTSPPIEGWDIPVSGGVSEPVVELDQPEPKTNLPDWSAPATGQVPAVLSSDASEDGWSDLDGPRWHGEDPEWGSEDLRDVFKDVEAAGPSKVVSFDDVDKVEPAVPGAAGSPQREDKPASRTPRVRERHRTVNEIPAGRNVPQAIAVGLGLAAIAFIAMKVETNIPILVIITAVCGLAASELYLKMREVGLHPATLLGITSVVSFPLSVYYRGVAAFGVVLALTMVFGALWYLVGADTDRPALNLGATFLGVMWIGVLGGFAILLATAIEGTHNLLLYAVVVTVMSDTGAFAGGSWLGKTPFHPASPGKTWEGTIIGVLFAIAGAMILWTIGVVPIGGDTGSWTHALYIGLVGGVLAPMGDLTESMVKRDLGTKDMGTLIPGHGGVLDRLDGMLFVVPGVYYLALLLGYI